MRHEIVCKPDFSMVKCFLDAGERVKAEPGAMAGMSSNMKLETKARGGLLSGLKRLVGGESFFQNTYWPEGGEGEIYFSPASMGDLHYYPMTGQDIMMQSGAYVCSSDGVEFDTKWSGAKSFFGGEGLFMLKATGQGDLFFSSFGAIHEVDVSGSYIVDTGAIVAFESTLNYTITKVGGMKSLFLGGEGLVCRFEGHGKLWIQTRQPTGFAGWLDAFRPVKTSND